MTPRPPFELEHRRRAEELRDIAAALTTLRFEGNVWDEALGRIRVAFDAEVTCRYLPEQQPNGWSIISMDVVAGSRAGSETVRRRVTPAIEDQLNQSPFYNPLQPDRRQRNRALLLSEVTRVSGSSTAAIQEYMAKLRLGHCDQIRALVCDGTQLLSWVGLLADHTFDEADRAAFQGVIPAFQSRLRFEQLVHHAAHTTAALEATLEAMPVPCFLLHRSGRVLEANAAGRLLRDLNPALMARVSALPRQPDPRFEIHPVLVHGVPASYVVTLRAAEASTSNRLSHRARHWGLTRRQATVLSAIVQGLANKEIASRLNIALGTVELHVTAILSKARTESRAALIAAYWDDS